MVGSYLLFSTIENFPKGKPILAKPDGYVEASLLSIGKTGDARRVEEPISSNRSSRPTSRRIRMS